MLRFARVTRFFMPLLLALMVSPLLAAETINGLFGLELGEQVDEERIYSKDDPEYEAAMEWANDQGRRLVGMEEPADMLPFLFPDKEEFSEELRSDFNNSMQGVEFLSVVRPPDPDPRFDSYLVFLTPQTHRIGGVWAFGKLEPCEPEVRDLAEQLQERYPRLTLREGSGGFYEGETEYVALDVGSVRVKIDCEGVRVEDSDIEAQIRREFEELVRRLYEEMNEDDASGI